MLVLLTRLSKKTRGQFFKMFPEAQEAPAPETARQIA